MKDCGRNQGFVNSNTAVYSQGRFEQPPVTALRLAMSNSCPTSKATKQYVQCQTIVSNMKHYFKQLF